MTGILLSRNLEKFDYCWRESLASVVAFCDRVIVMDCGSDDGTDLLLKKEQEKYSTVDLALNQPWEVSNNHTRLEILYNQLRSMVKTPWYFLAQADEVVHENSQTAIRAIVLGAIPGNTFYCRRMNFWRDFNHYVSFDAKNKPCGDSIIRLGKQDVPVCGDAESICASSPNSHFKDKILIFHYGYVRNGAKLIDKAIDLQSWFWGPGGRVDPEVIKMKNGDGIFDPSAWHNDEVTELVGTHPKYAEQWIKNHEIDPTFRRC